MSNIIEEMKIRNQIDDLEKEEREINIAISTSPMVRRLHEIRGALKELQKLLPEPPKQPDTIIEPSPTIQNPDFIEVD